MRLTNAWLRKLGLSSSPRETALHDYYNVYEKTKRRLEELIQDRPLTECRILDLGCGYSYPMVALFNGEVAEICGADIETAFFRDGRVRTFRATARERGTLRAVKRAGPVYSFHRRYHRVLAALADRSPEHAALSLHTYDGHRLPFPDEHFHAVISNAVLEQVKDLQSFVDESARVLRSGGVVDMLWHNFYCPSGGYRDSREAARSPWGHLTGESPASHLLNRKRPDEMQQAFAKRFTILRLVGADRNHVLRGEPGFRAEGLDLLNDAWRHRLSDYSQDLLITRSFLLQASKA